jgi:hypothetical protein
MYIINLFATSDEFYFWNLEQFLTFLIHILQLFCAYFTTSEPYSYELMNDNKAKIIKFKIVL